MLPLKQDKFMRKYILALTLFLSTFNIANAELKITLPEFIIAGIEQEIKIESSGLNGSIPVIINGNDELISFDHGTGTFLHTFNADNKNIIVSIGSDRANANASPIPLWLSILPPLIAILMALVFKEVIVSLFTGIFAGAAILFSYGNGITGVFSGFLAVIDRYIINAMNDSGHLSVIVFSLLIGAMVLVISRNGGMQGVVNRLSKYAKDSRSGQLVTWFLGIAIFFDDYANTLVVGNTMRPVTDRLKISREKLSYIVDSTAAPIAAIAFVTTWIGAELGYIEDGSKTLGIEEGAYSIFLNSLNYAFYPILTLIFIFMLIWMKKDFGTMYNAEKRARVDGHVSDPKHKIGKSEETDDLDMVDGAKPKAYNAIIPVLVVIIGTIVGLYNTGIESNEGIWSDSSLSFTRKLSTIIGSSDSYIALLWSSISGLGVAILLTVSQKIISLQHTMETALVGFKTMLPAISILILAWSLALVTEDMHTADFITGGLSSANLSPVLIPTLTFLLAAIVAFSTGSSWGTMAILYPLMLPATWKLAQDAGLDHDTTMMIFYNVVSTILAGSVLGDHCSPISDTTILSSLASSCNHIDHVKTQLPYALTVGGVSVLLGTLPAAFGVPVWILFPLGIGTLYLIIRFMGKDSDFSEEK